MLSTFLIIIIFTIAVFALASLLTFIAMKFKVEADPMQGKVDACLPQAQCGQCGYVGCAEYAKAIVEDGAPINLCTPGGSATVKALADLLKVPVPKSNNEKDTDEEIVANIDQSLCIGCTKCAKACPYDAIIGTLKNPHVVQEQFCTGCEKCVATCPKNCIAMKPIFTTIDNWDWKIKETVIEGRD